MTTEWKWNTRPRLVFDPPPSCSWVPHTQTTAIACFTPHVRSAESASQEQQKPKKMAVPGYSNSANSAAD